MNDAEQLSLSLPREKIYLRFALLIFAQSHSIPSLTPTPVRALLDL